MKKKILIALLAILILLAAGAIGVFAYAESTVKSVKDDQVAKGVYIEDVDLSGMTQDEVQQVIDDKVAAMNEKTITMVTNGNEDSLTLSTIGVSCTNEDIVDEIMGLTKSGNLLERFKAVKELQKSNKTYTLEYEFDQTALKDYVKNTLKKTYNRSVKEPSIKRKDGEFVVKKGRKGIKVQVNDTVDAINEVLNSTEENITVETVCKITKPEHSYKDLEAIQDVLGSCTTVYDGSNVGRTQSLVLSTKRLNGTVVWPGETISVSELMGERSVAGGYGSAAGYVGTNVEDTVGAGICQTASTLYDAALWAELDIVERDHHTLIVHYVPYAMDSTIYAGNDYKNPQKDLKLKNPYDYPIYIQSSVGGGYCSFKIWGKETRPSNRTIDYVSTTFYETYPSEDSVTYDSSKYEDYYEVTQGAFPAVKASLTKYVYIDGKQTEKTVLHTDTYSASARKVIKGSKKKKTEETTKSSDEKKEESSSGDESKESSETKKNTDSGSDSGSSSGSDSKKES